MGFENNFNSIYFHHHYLVISKLVSVEMACLLGIQNEILAACNTCPMNRFKPVPQSRQQALRAYCLNLYTVRYSLARRTQAHWLQGGQFREEKTSFQLEKRNALVKMKMPALNWLPFHLLTRGVCVMPFSVTTAVASLRFDPFFPMLGASIKSKLFTSIFIGLDP